MNAIPIGAHVSSADPLAHAAACSAEALQFFLSPPRSFKKPAPRPDSAELASAAVPIYVHAPYLINVGSGNNRVRIPSRKILADTVLAAAAVGAAGVVVHGGQLDDSDDFSVAVVRWRKALQAFKVLVPVLIENTAGGDNSIARRIDAYEALWQGIGDLNVGVCLDTCHAWAAGEDLATVVGRLQAATGRVDLVHCNDSRDPNGSGRDRHANLGKGEIPGEMLAAVAAEAGCPVIVETPGEAADHTADIAWLRARL